MAKVHVTLARVGARADTGSTLPITDAEPDVAKTVEATDVSQDAGLTVAASIQLSSPVWTVTALTGAVWVAFGAAPVAGPDGGWLLAAGETRSFGARAGQRVAVRDAA